MVPDALDQPPELPGDKGNGPSNAVGQGFFQRPGRDQQLLSLLQILLIAAVEEILGAVIGHQGQEEIVAGIVIEVPGIMLVQLQHIAGGLLELGEDLAKPSKEFMDFRFRAIRLMMLFK